jgi:hypothetical protein
VECSTAALGDTVQTSPLTPDVQAPNVCAATARRLAEIARRNEIRRDANQPALSIATEMRRMKVWEDEKDFERFESTHGKAIWE